MAKTFSQRLNDLMTGVNLLISLPFIGKLFKDSGEKLAEKFEASIGLTAEGATKVFDDEISFVKVITKGNLTPEEKKEIKEWLGRLREKKPKLAGEFTRWIHNAMIKLGRQVKVSTGPKENREERTFIDDQEGILVAESLIRDILAETDDEERIEVLKIFDIKIIKKEPSPSAEKVKDFTRKTKEQIVEGEKQNRTELQTASATWVEKAKAWRERS